jgi:signal transduction histidine kinase/ligand-binding sensor domain-containing protein
VHESWGPEEGLPQSTGLALARTRDGFLWVGTEEGLARFDGVRFVVHDRRNTPGLPHNVVYALLGSRDGSLWVGTAAGLARLVEGSAHPWGAQRNVPERAVRCLLEDRAGAVWAGTSGGGLVRVEGETATSVTTRDGLPSDEVSSLLEDPDGTLWIATSRGLARRSPDGRIAAVALPGARSGRLRGLCRGRDGSLWVGSDSGIVRLKGGVGRLLGSSDGLSNERVHTLETDRDGNVWVATAAGLCRVGASVSCLVEPGPISPTPVFPILEDDAGDLWFGSAGGGLHRLSDSSFRVFGRPEGLPANAVLTFLEARDGRFWVGTYAAGLAVLDGSSVRTFTRADGLPDDTVVSLHEARDGVVWVATKGGLSAIAGNAVRPALVPRGLPSADLFAVTEDAAGTLWVASDAGLSRRDGARFVTLGAADGLPSPRLRMMKATRDGAVWVGAAGGGLARVLDGRVTLFGAAEGLPAATVYALHEEADGTLWAGTLGGGLVRGKGGRFRAFTERDGLFDDTVYEVLDDLLGNLWLTSNRGIAKVSKADLAAYEAGTLRSVPVAVFGTDEGLRSAECNGAGEPSGLLTRDGRIWFATQGGAALLDPRARESGAPQAVPRIEQVLVDGRPVPHVAGVVLPAGREALEIRYTAPVFRAPERVRFRYELSGFDESPVDAGSRRTAIYTNLTPGRYTFTVAVSAKGDAFGPSSVALPVRVKPRLHQTWWFLSLAVAATLGTAWALHAVRVRLLRLRARELEDLVADRTKLLLVEKERTEEANRVKSQFLANVTHDLRTPLNAIIGYADLLSEQAGERGLEEFAEDLGRIRRAAEHQLALVNDVLDLAKVEAGRLDVTAETVDLPRFLGDLLATVEPMVRRNGNALETEGVEEAGLVRTDPTRLRQILLNLLSNAARHTSNGVVRLEASRAGGDALLRVRDTGVGMSPEEVAGLFREYAQAKGGDPRGGTGLGLAISRRLARLLGGDISVESAPGRGSAFTLRIPSGGT